jgi:hypothetical protein
VSRLHNAGVANIFDVLQPLYDDRNEAVREFPTSVAELQGYDGQSLGRAG